MAIVVLFLHYNVWQLCRPGNIAIDCRFLYRYYIMLHSWTSSVEGVCVCVCPTANHHRKPSVLMVDELLSAYPHQLSFSEAGMRIMITSHFSPRTRLTMASRMLITEVRTHLGRCSYAFDWKSKEKRLLPFPIWKRPQHVSLKGKSIQSRDSLIN